MNNSTYAYSHRIFRQATSKCSDQTAGMSSDSFTILSLWVLGLAVSHINESNCKLPSGAGFYACKVGKKWRMVIRKNTTLVG